MFSFDVARWFCVSVFLCLCVQRTGQSGASLKWELNANSSKTVKATYFKFDTGVPRDSPGMTARNFSKRGRGQSHVIPKYLRVKC